MGLENICHVGIFITKLWSIWLLSLWHRHVYYLQKIICAIVNHSCMRILFIGSISLGKMQDHNIRQLCYPNGPGGGICCSTNAICSLVERISPNLGFYFLNGNFINKEGYNVRGMLQRKPESNTWAYKVNNNVDLGRKSEKQSLWATIKLYLWIPSSAESSALEFALLLH